VTAALLTTALLSAVVAVWTGVFISADFGTAFGLTATILGVFGGLVFLVKAEL
jgi:hypothetical protein